MAGDFGSTGGINSRGMPDRVERAYSRRDRGRVSGTVSADYEQDLIPYEKKPFFREHPVVWSAWVLSLLVTVAAVWLEIELWMAKPIEMLLIAMFTLVPLLLVTTGSLAAKYARYKRIEAVVEGAEEETKKLLETLE